MTLRPAALGWSRFPAFAVAALAIGLAALSGSRLVSVLYAKYSRELAPDAQQAPYAEAAALQSQRWAAWREDGYRAQLRSGSNDLSVPMASTIAALRWSPSDPYLWAELAQLLVQNDRFGRPLGVALQNINQLAPNSPALQWVNAFNAIARWPYGDPDVRREWIRSLQFMLRTDGGVFLHTVENRGLAQRLCWTAGPELNLAAWCDAQLRD